MMQELLFLLKNSLIPPDLQPEFNMVAQGTV